MPTPSPTSVSFSFRPPEPPRPAAALLAEIRERGGRVYRMMGGGRVFCLTSSAELAAWLLDLGGRGYTTAGLTSSEGGYPRARDGAREWDVYIHTIPVEGDLWEAAG